jgi:hypothetical protein
MTLADHYVRFIQWIGDGTGAPDTILHIHAGMAVLLLSRVITGRSLATMVPLASVYVAELANEVLDYFGHGRVMPDTLSDVVNTVFWPTVLFIGLRVRRARLDHASRSDLDRRYKSASSGLSIVTDAVKQRIAG